MTAVRLGREFGLRVTVEPCTEGHKVAGALSEAGVPALVGPSHSSRSKMGLRELSFATAGELARAGCKGGPHQRTLLW